MSIIEKVISTLAPDICYICQEEGKPLCFGCVEQAFFSLPSRCFMCNATTKNNQTCSICKRKSAIKNAWIAGEYSEPLKSLIKEYKFMRKRSYANVFANKIASSLPYFENLPLVTFVPTATSRVRARGFDQAELLAKNLASIIGARCMRLLVKTSQTRQVGANRQTRLAQLEGSFRTIRKSYILSSDILLVDDVITTGSTLRVAASELKSAGAKKIYAAVIAQN